MRNFILIIFCISSLFLYGQNEFTKEKIDSVWSEAILQIPNFKRIILRDTSIQGKVDSINFYFSNNELIYIKKVHCSAGLAMIESMQNEEYFYFDKCLILIRKFGRWDNLEYGNSDQSSTSVSEELIYLKKNGECLIQFYPREAEGTRLTYMENLKKTPLKQQDCMYFAPDTKHNGDKYIKLLINQKPEFKYLLKD